MLGLRYTCLKNRIFSTDFDTQGGADFGTVNGVMYSGQISFNLMVPSSFSVGFSSDNAITKPGFVLSCKILSKRSLDGSAL